MFNYEHDLEKQLYQDIFNWLLSKEEPIFHGMKIVPLDENNNEIYWYDSEIIVEREPNVEYNMKLFLVDDEEIEPFISSSIDDIKDNYNYVTINSKSKNIEKATSIRIGKINLIELMPFFEKGEDAIKLNDPKSTELYNLYKFIINDYNSTYKNKNLSNTDIDNYYNSDIF